MITQRYGQTPRLTAQQEIDLAHRIRQGDREARDKLIIHNIGLVAFLTPKLKPKYAERHLDDLIAAALVGLIEAADAFDASRNCRFGTCALEYIRKQLTIAVQNEIHLVRVPRHAHEALQAHLEGKPIRKNCSSSKAVLRAARRAIHTRATGGGIGGDIHSIRGNDSASGAHEVSLRNESDDTDRLRVALKTLDRTRPRNAEVIRMRYGIARDGLVMLPMTQEEVGRMLGFTKQWIAQIEEKGLAELRVMLTGEYEVPIKKFKKKRVIS